MVNAFGWCGEQRTRTLNPTLIQQKTQPRKMKRSFSDSLTALRPALLFLQKNLGVRANLNNCAKKATKVENTFGNLISTALKRSREQKGDSPSRRERQEGSPHLLQTVWMTRRNSALFNGFSCILSLQSNGHWGPMEMLGSGLGTSQKTTVAKGSVTYPRLCFASIQPYSSFLRGTHLVGVQGDPVGSRQGPGAVQVLVSLDGH